jgi:hypothetical protein
MKPWTTWLARFAIAGGCFLVTGCGGSDVPDASDDGQASTERAPAAGAGGGAPAAPAPVEGPKIAQGDQAAGGAETPAEPVAAPAQAPEPETPPAAAASPTEGQGNSSTSEMLAIATGSSGGANAAGGSAPPGEDSAAIAANASGSPGIQGGGAMQPPGGPGRGMAMGQGMMSGGRMGPGMFPGMGQGAPAGMAPGAGANEMLRQQAGAMTPPSGMGANAMANNRGPGGPGGQGGPGYFAGAGGPGSNDGPADFRSPQGAVKAFLAALKAKDLERLNESTALRAPVEAGSAKGRELFKKIFDLNLSESELDTLAEALDGYNIAGENPAQSTARVDVILQKPGKNGAYSRRKVTVRHEKKGWGVLDVAGAMEFKSMGVIRQNTGGGRR